MIDFIKNKKIYFTISIVLIVITLLVSFIFGVKMDIQFKGGSILTYSYEGELPKDKVKAEVETALNKLVNVSQKKDVTSGATSIEITLAETSGISSDEQILLSETIEKTFPENNLKLKSSSSVDPVIGKEFFLKSLVAVAFSSLLMIIYIGFRFRKIGGWSAGVMAVIALLHDIMIVFATFVIFRIPLDANFIAVVLTILGYSINDTIVIYDRIRENQNLYGAKMSYAELVNKSTNQSLTRSLVTSFTTVIAMVVICIVALICNVNSIISFAFPLIIGMISGSYSSICISGPLWVMWKEHRAKVKAGKK